MFKLVIVKIKEWLKLSVQENMEQLVVKEQPLQQEIVTPRSYKQSAEKSEVSQQTSNLSKSTLQEKINSVQAGETLQIWPPGGEYPCPIVINRPLILDGQGATLWTLKGPAIIIQSEQVSLRNLRIEVTGENNTNNPKDNCAIFVKSGQSIQFDNIEVRGAIMGIPAEEGDWQYPQSLHIGKINHGQEYNFLLRIVVPVDCQIAAGISGLEFNPSKLKPGLNDIQIHIEAAPKDTLINGDIFLVSTSVKRRVTFTAYIVSLPQGELAYSHNYLIWEPEKQVGNQLLESDIILNDFPDPYFIETGEATTSTPTDEEISEPKRKQSRISRDVQPLSNIFKAEGNIQEESASLEPSIAPETSKLGDAFSRPNKDDTTKTNTEPNSELLQPEVPLLFQKQSLNNQQNVSISQASSKNCLPLPNVFAQKIGEQLEQNVVTFTTSQQSKRKIVRSNNISPLFWG